MGTRRYLSINVYPAGDRWLCAILIREPGGKSPRLIRDVRHFELNPYTADLAGACREAALVLLAEFPDDPEF